VTGVTTSDGVRLYAEAAGSGPPILFIHEFAADHRTWTRQVEALSGEFRCITYDARGYPPSEVPKEQERYSYIRQAADAIDVLDAFGVGKAHIAGLSRAWSAQLCASRVRPRSWAQPAGQRRRSVTSHPPAL
jgi:pimeloyl-ACP methyl ester carboxylesterase